MRFWRQHTLHRKLCYESAFLALLSRESIVEVFFTENFIFGLMHPHVHVSDAEGQRILEPIDHMSQNFVMGLNTITRRGQQRPTHTQ
jgi:hypothetical protein